MIQAPRSIRKRLLLALATLPFLGVVAAFGIAPDTATEQIPRETIVETLALPEAQFTDSGSFDFWREERIGRGDSLPGLLSRLGVNAADTRAFLDAARETKALARLVPGRTVLARVSSGGQLLLFRYLASDENLVSVTRAGGQLKAEQRQVALESRLIMRSG